MDQIITCGIDLGPDEVAVLIDHRPTIIPTIKYWELTMPPPLVPFFEQLIEQIQELY